MTESNVGLPTSEGNQFPEIRGRMIRVDDAGRVSLTDVWKAAGSPTEREPYKWGRLPDTLKSIDALSLHVRSNGGFSPNEVSQGVIATKRGGSDAGTWAHPNLAIQYAGYLSPDLRIEIHEVFLRYKIADPTLTADLIDRTADEHVDWLDKRLQSKRARVQLTDTFAAHGVEGRGYPDCTNASYRGLMGTDASGLRQERGLPKGANVRDRLSSTELLEVALSEAYAKQRIEALNDHGNAECARSCFVTGKLVRDTREKMERQIEEEREVRGLPS